MSTASSERRKIGDLRPSQLLYTFGVGAIVELPNLSVMVMGLDDWPMERGASVVTEPRLLRAVQDELGPQVVRLLTPPITPESTGFQSSPFDDTANVGVPVAPFPRWLVCPYCRLLSPVQSGLFELRLDPYRKDRSRFVHRICKRPKPPTVVPARFLVACENGHLSDFPWVEFAHRGPTDCKYELRLDEFGASGEVADIQVRCAKCESRRRMSDAFSEEGRDELALCRGRWPHLRSFDDKRCEAPQKAILLGASNSWFPVMLSTLSIPSTTDKLGQLIEQNWTELEECESAREVKLKRKLLHGLTAYADEQVWSAVQARKSQGSASGEEASVDLRDPEWKVFSSPNPALNSRDFRLRTVAPPPGYERWIERVVLAERLREVRSLIGFTRIESPGDYSDVAEFPEEKRVPLSRAAPLWVPTSEVRGEGVFLQLAEAAVAQWASRVQALDGDFFEAHRRWRRARGLEANEGYPTVRYVLLHSLAHALIRQFALECGYSTASVRERIYSRVGGEREPMAGILLYTAAPDSEGTLGGLVSLGEPATLARHLNQALEGIRLCASDPLCAENHPRRNSLAVHGAACHACLFLPETSCERGNRYLDRAVLVNTWESKDSAFFEQP